MPSGGRGIPPFKKRRLAHALFPTSPRKSLWHSLPRKSKKEFDSDDQTVHARFAVQHMSGICRTNFALWLAALLCLASSSLWAESGVLVVHVKDVQRHPISGVQIGVEGTGDRRLPGMMARRGFAWPSRQEKRAGFPFRF